MAQTVTIPGERLAGLSADLFVKVQHGKITLDELALFLKRQNPFEAQPILSDTFRVDYSIRGTYPDRMKKRLHPEFDRVDTVEHHLDQVRFWLDPDQENGGFIGGKVLYEHIKKNNILPTCLALRDLEEIQKLGIEVYRKYFRGKAIFAWKDVVQDRNGNLFVPYLIEGDDRVVLRWSWLGFDWHGNDPAARLAS